MNDRWAIDEHDQRVYDYNWLYVDLSELFPIMDFAREEELSKYPPGPELLAFIQDLAHRAYDAKVESLGEELMGRLEQMVMLQAVNDRWMEHLQTVEYVREGISLRGYGQVDPLVAYKRETFDLFQITLK